MYAMNREYSQLYGRFLQPDPYQASGGPADPGSWNRYAYVQGDPVSRIDRLGLMEEAPDEEEESEGEYQADSIDEYLESLDYTAYNVGATFSVTGQDSAPPAEPQVALIADVSPEVSYVSSIQPDGSTGGESGGGGGGGASGAAQSGTIKCVNGLATYKGVGGNQARAAGALSSRYPKAAGGSIRGGTFGTVAVKRGFLGLSTRSLRKYGNQIYVTPEGDQDLISQLGGPRGPLTVSDYGDPYIQSTPGTAFDIYRFPTRAAGRQFGTRKIRTTITFPAASGGDCPPGYTKVKVP
jgi:hypothetical protein